MSRLRRVVPVVVVTLALVALGYPLALLFGLPPARQRMSNLSNWTKVTVQAQPVAELPAPGGPGSAASAGDDAEDAGSPAGARLVFERVPAAGLLVRGTTPLGVDYRTDGGGVLLLSALSGPLQTWGGRLEGPLDVSVPTVPTDAAVSDTAPGDMDLDGAGDAATAAGYLFRVPDPEDLTRPLYQGGHLLVPGSVETIERADGQRTVFHFPADPQEPAGIEDPPAGDRVNAEAPPVLVGERLMLEGTDVRTKGRTVSFEEPPPFNASVRRVTGGYAVLDPAAGIIVLAEPATEPPRAALASVRLAERLDGAVDGKNRRFRLQHAPLVESDRDRRLFLGDHELNGEAERPEERVDGTRTAFTFASDVGIVTVDGRPAVEGTDYERARNVVTFTTPPARNAALRQYRDYLVDDPASGSVTLAVAPEVGAELWASSYTYYGEPTCGSTAMACFLSMAQHPVPFPHWIAERVVPFFSAYPLSDGRNVVRAVLYTALGTLWALLLGGAFGVLLAVAFVSVQPLERALLPWVIASQTVPIIALVPVLLLILGNAGVTVQTSLVPTALIGAYIAFFPVTVGTVTGLRSVDPLALDLMRSYAASPLQVFVKLRFPAAVPLLFTSLKLGAAAALVGALVAETESNNSRGLGYAIIGQVQAGDVSDVWLLLLVSAALGIALVAIVGLVERLTAPWQRTLG